MSDRIIAYTVVLDKDYKDEDAKYIKQALEMIKGVSAVEEKIADPDYYFAVHRARSELVTQIREILKP